MQPGAAQAVTTFQVDCNWLQMLEGDLDTSHLGVCTSAECPPTGVPSLSGRTSSKR